MNPMEQRSTSSNRFQCNLCDKSYVRKHALKTHQSIVHNIGKCTKYICVFCNKQFVGLTKLEYHFRMHIKERPYFCKICVHESSLPEYLEAHLKTHLGKYKTLTETQKKLFSEFDLNQHLRNLNEKPFKCKVCEKRFAQLQNLKNHEKSHSDTRPFECDVCKYKSKRSGDLKKHKQIHSKESPFLCQICKTRFNFKGALIGHMRIHTGEKPYRCKICKKDFSRQDDLRNHEKIHSEELLFSCRICFKRFRQRSGLRNHLRTHSEEKPYGCKFCKNCFRRNSHLKKHLKLHKNETL